MEKLATHYAVALSKAKSLDELRRVWVEINGRREELGREWYLWLVDQKDGCKITFSPDKDILSEEGKKWKTKNF